MKSVARRARESYLESFPAASTGEETLSICARRDGRMSWSSSQPEHDSDASSNQHHTDSANYEVTFEDTSDTKDDVVVGQSLGHYRNHSTGATASRISKRFSVQPQAQAQPPSPTGSLADSALPRYESMAAADPVGEEPGIDINTMEVDIPDGVGSQVTIVDYCDADCKITHYDVPKGRESIVSGSNDRRALGRRLDKAIAERPSWGRVRWIVVNGLSWEALRPIAAHYHLHPLALEDVLEVPQRTKVEVHQEQVHCCFPMHTLHITPTPFSLLHSIARKCVIQIYQVIKGVRFLCSYVGGLFFSLYLIFKLWLSRFRNSSCKDAEQQQPQGDICTVHGKAHSRTHSVCSSANSSSFDEKAGDKEETSKRVSSDIYASSQWSDSCATLTGQDECIPFFTTNHGTLCSNTESTPVEAAISQLPARSMYEWNYGNLALHNEALQTMRIRGSANSFEVAIEQVSLFLLPDTVITIFERSASSVYEPIQNRLLSPLTLLRQSNDASVLVQAIFDASVDLVRPILQEYRSQLSRLQVEGVHQPTLRHTRALHAFTTDLTMMRSLVRSLASLVDALSLKGMWADLEGKYRGSSDEKRSPVHKPISPKAAEYLCDVADHAKAYIEDLDGMYAQSQTLNSLIFDTISIRAGDSVKMLSLVSVIFLPLTFLTGYFGMNFKSFTTLDHDVGYYWLVSTPAAAALTVILMYPTAVSQVQEWWSWAKLQV